jgi:hypothetical protein
MSFGGQHHRPAIRVAQSPIRNHGIIEVIPQLLDGVMGRSRSRHGMPGSFEDLALQGDYVRFVIHTQDSRHSVCPGWNFLHPNCRYSLMRIASLSMQQKISLRDQSFRPIDLAWVNSKR